MDSNIPLATPTSLQVIGGQPYQVNELTGLVTNFAYVFSAQNFPGGNTVFEYDPVSSGYFVRFEDSGHYRVLKMSTTSAAELGKLLVLPGGGYSTASVEITIGVTSGRPYFKLASSTPNLKLLPMNTLAPAVTIKSLTYRVNDMAGLVRGAIYTFTAIYYPGTASRFEHDPVSNGYFVRFDDAVHLRVLLLDASAARSLDTLLSSAGGRSTVEMQVSTLTGLPFFQLAPTPAPVAPMGVVGVGLPMGYYGAPFGAPPPIHGVPADVAVVKTTAKSLCNCGGHMTGYADFSAGHGNWCKVAMKR